jgi:hypothetical protein
MLLQPKQSCWNVRSLLSGLGGAIYDQWAVKSPWMLQDGDIGFPTMVAAYQTTWCGTSEDNSIQVLTL